MKREKNILGGKSWVSKEKNLSIKTESKFAIELWTWDENKKKMMEKIQKKTKRKYSEKIWKYGSGYT